MATLHWLSKLSPRDSSGVVNEEWEHWHGEFHIGMRSGCKSSMTLQFCETLLDLSNRYRRLFPPPTPMQREVHREAIADAALARDADRACEIIKGAHSVHTYAHRFGVAHGHADRNVDVADD